MRNEKPRELDCRLKNGRFGFLGLGESHLRDIYVAVKREYPSLCDDDFMCCEC
jgi:hypothetical protein